MLEIFRRRQLFTKSPKCEFGRQERGCLGHRLSNEGVSADPRKVQTIVGDADVVLRGAAPPELANHYRRFVAGSRHR